MFAQGRTNILRDAFNITPPTGTSNESRHKGR